MTTTDGDDGTPVTPLPRPEVAAGARLDKDHEPRTREPLAGCVLCGFATDDSLDRTLRHYPLPEELAHVDTWLAAYGARSDS